jgi:hypothetical protein
VLVYFLVWIGFSLFPYPLPPVWGLVCGSPAFTFSGAGLCSPALLVQASCCQLSRFWSCRSFFTRGIQSASSPAAVNTVGDLDSGPDQTCLKIHFLVSSLLLFSDLGPACDFYARAEPLQLA